MVAHTAICSSASDTTILAADSSLDKVIERLDNDVLVLSKRFPETFMKLNEGKCNLLTFGTIQSNIKIKIKEAIVEESSDEKLLGVMINKQLSFKVIFRAYVSLAAYGSEPVRNCTP